jgi:hypothetical protein
LGREGGSANMRGEEMMQGEEMAALETEIWGREKKGDETIGIEVELKKGDGLYIPLGWWHAVRNTAKGPNVSVSCAILLTEGVNADMCFLQVNWWFR